MRKLRNLLGMPVIYRRRKIGRLVQADLSGDLKRMEGIWVDGGLRGTRYIPSEQLAMIGRMAVMADSRGVRKKCTAGPLLKRAVDTGGNRIGAVTDAQIDEISFLVCALELTRGVWNDLFTGRSLVADFSVQDGQVLILDSAQTDLKEVEP